MPSGPDGPRPKRPDDCGITHESGIRPDTLPAPSVPEHAGRSSRGADASDGRVGIRLSRPCEGRAAGSGAGIAGSAGTSGVGPLRVSCRPVSSTWAIGGIFVVVAGLPGRAAAEATRSAGHRDRGGVVGDGMKEQHGGRRRRQSGGAVPMSAGDQLCRGEGARRESRLRLDAAARCLGMPIDSRTPSHPLPRLPGKHHRCDRVSCGVWNLLVAVPCWPRTGSAHLTDDVQGGVARRRCV
jgi:hypothetical protein